jgi:hypothetical protein
LLAFKIYCYQYNSIRIPADGTVGTTLLAGWNETQ